MSNKSIDGARMWPTFPAPESTGTPGPTPPGDRQIDRIVRSAVRSVSGRSLALAVALGCAAAGGGAGAASSAGPASPAQALARSELLAVTAYPHGWTGQGSGTDSTQASTFGGSDTTMLAQITRCLGIPAAAVDTHPVEAAAQAYADSNSNAVMTDTVEVFPTTQFAAADVEALNNPKMPTCLEHLFALALSDSLSSWLGPNAAVGQVTVSKHAIPDYGAHTGDLVVAGSFTQEGVSGTDYLDIVEVQRGRSESVLMFDNTGSRVSARIIDQLTRSAADRLR